MLINSNSKRTNFFVFLSLVLFTVFSVVPVSFANPQNPTFYTLDWPYYYSKDGKLTEINTEGLSDYTVPTRRINGYYEQNGNFEITKIQEGSYDSFSDTSASNLVNLLHFGEITFICQSIGFRKGFIGYRPKIELVTDTSLEKDITQRSKYWYPAETPWYAPAWINKDAKDSFHEVTFLKCLK